MLIQSLFNKISSSADLTHTLKNAQEKTGAELNCCRVGFVKQFYPEDITADILIVNKRPLEQNPDGTQKVKDYALIRAKVCYCSPYETFPLEENQEGILLFSDREIESWFINGQSNVLQYPRMHHLTDAIFIAGLRSLPRMIQILQEALHLFYGGSDIQLWNDKINTNTTIINTAATEAINENTNDYTITAENSFNLKTNSLDTQAQSLTVNIPTISITGNTTQNGNITATALGATSAASGVFRSEDGKIITVVNGIITGIS